MTREEKVMAMRDIVRSMGEKCQSESMTMWSVILPISLLGCDVYTDVSIEPDDDDPEALTIGGYDGEWCGWCRNVNRVDDHTIDIVYEAMLEWVKGREENTINQSKNKEERTMKTFVSYLYSLCECVFISATVTFLVASVAIGLIGVDTYHIGANHPWFPTIYALIAFGSYCVATLMCVYEEKFFKYLDLGY